MQFINYFFASLISFLGLLIGCLLVKIAPEEQKPLRKKIFLLRKIFLLLIFLLLIFGSVIAYYYNKPAYLLIIIFSAIFLLFAEYKLKDLLKRSALDYAAFGILFFISSENIAIFATTSSLILLYGAVAALLIYNSRQKNLAKIFLCNAGFVIVANALFYLKF